MAFYLNGLPVSIPLAITEERLTNTPDARQKASDDINKVDASIRQLISDVDSEQISKNLFCLAKDLLPYRKLNMTLPGRFVL